MSYIIGNTDITIRLALPADRSGLSRLAGRDSASLPAEPLLVAEVGGSLRAAMSLTNGAVVADPFHRTAELVEMLGIRARGVAASAPDATTLTFRRPRRARLAFRTAA
jgi:hypothetical protein